MADDNIKKSKSILYIVRYPLDYTYSIMQKINGQIQAFKEIGFNVSFLCFDRKNVYINTNGVAKALGKTTFGFSRFYFHFFSYYDLYKWADKSIKLLNFDYIYFRMAPLTYNAIRFFRNASTKTTIIVENPSYSLRENEKQKNFFRIIYNKYSKKLWKKAVKYVDLFSVIGDYTTVFMGKPAVNINNGVSLSVIPLRKAINPDDNKIHILCVASMCDWHAYDRLINGLALWNSPDKSNYIIDLVGDEGDGSLQKWRELVDSLKLQKQVIFHGRKTGDDLSFLFNIASVGVSSLGFYRVGYTSGSVLKLREYMARGLPFVYAHEDPDISEKMNWCLKVANSAEPIDMDSVDKFIKKIRSIDSISKKMRIYASNNMTWEAQFEKMFKMLESLKNE